MTPHVTLNTVKNLISNNRRVATRKLLACTLLWLVTGFVFAADNVDAVATGKALRVDIRTETLVLTDDIDIARAQVNAYPSHPEAHFLLAVAYSRSPYVEKAIASLRKAKKLMKRSPEGYQNLDAKLAEYEGMRDYDPNDALVLYRLAFGYYSKGYGIEKGYIKDSPDAPALYYDKAIATMRQVIATDPDDYWARNYLGLMLIELDEEKHLSEAIRLWEGSIGIEDNNPGAYVLLGEAYLQQGNLKKAARYAARGLQYRLSHGVDF